MNSFKDVLEAVKAGKNFLITCHAHPDGDGIGSSISLGLWIESLGKRAVVFNADAVPYNLRFLPGWDKVVQKLPAGENFDATILVDCSELKRAESDSQKFDRNKLGRTILIDHHMVKNKELDIICVDENAAAAGEVVYRLFNFAGVKITPDIATNLFCTFVVDSGSFRYSNTTAELLRSAADLVDAGASPWAVSMALDESNPPEYIKLLRLVLATFETSPKKDVAWIVLTQQMLDECQASKDVAEEFINFPRSIQGVEVAILFRELKNGKWKVSFRSKDKADVFKIAVLFEGGGHKHAAGCTLEGSLANVKEKILKAVSL